MYRIGFNVMIIMLCHNDTFIMICSMHQFINGSGQVQIRKSRISGSKQPYYQARVLDVVRLHVENTKNKLRLNMYNWSLSTHDNYIIIMINNNK